MIILDTNVLSEPLKPKGDRGVTNWLDQQAAETLYFTSISLSEIWLGVELLPPGKRKTLLANGLEVLLTTLFDTRILPFDREAATRYGSLLGKARATGKVVSMADGQISAIASVHGFKVATRDTAPFVALGIPVINPWAL